MKAIRIYGEHLQKKERKEAELFLNDEKSFQVFVEFISPINNLLVQGYATLWAPVLTTTVNSFLAEVNGVVLKIPASFDWWAVGDIESKYRTVQQKAVLLEKGRYVEREFNVLVSRAIRPCI